MSCNRECVLVSGGAGYIGTHTTVALIEAGYDVVVVDNFSNSDASAISGVEKIVGRKIAFHQVDTCDRDALKRVFEQHGFNSVIHFAAFKAVGESVADPLKYYQNNLVSFMNILDLMKEYQRPNVLFSSSATVYGDTDTLPVTEESPRQPAMSPYGNTKQIAEDVLRDCCRAYDAIYGIALRYFNPIGAHPSALIGELPRGVPNNLLPYVTQTAAGVRQCLSIFGNDYDTPDGTCLRDYIDVVDLARAHVAALARMLHHGMKDKYEIFNVGTGNPVSVLELVNSFIEANGVDVPFKISGRRQGDVPAVWADTALANKELGWKTERNLTQTLRAAWAWEKHLRNID
ncbi:MAG: UDP-glucose 4-epimerase GalE [Muribaculaceae bacterium]|nr:UDP-glucose 4-epimerase GalE [Muribaculaceae bacterium]